MEASFKSWDRREFLQFIGVGAAVLGTPSVFAQKNKSPFLIKPLNPTDVDDLVLTEGLSSQLVVSWKDPINTRGERFGFNNDFIAALGNEKNKVLLWVNHEYPNPLFISGSADWKTNRKVEQIEAERKEVGGSFVGFTRETGGWQIDLNRSEARRIDANTMIPFAWPHKIQGATEAKGTLANCAGGVTPWGTVLTCEENYQDYYGEVEFLSRKRIVKRGKYSWDLAEDLPPEHYGWVVEVNPKTGQAKKMVAMGRFSHECATCVRAKDGRAVVYSADDKNDEHIYKFISKSADNLDHGDLYVGDTKKGRWLLLDLKRNPKLKARFTSQTELLVRTREAAKILGATPIDRPEDIERDPITGDIIIACTNNIPKKRFHGSLLKISEMGNDPASLKFKSEIYLMGGEKNGFSCPDNLEFDSQGNLWMASDISGEAMNKGPYVKFKNNGLFVIPRSGPQAGQVIRVASAPKDAEFTGPRFYGDTLFLSVQHPGEDSESYDHFSSHWPDGGGNVPRPSVVAIRGNLFKELGIG